MPAGSDIISIRLLVSRGPDWGGVRGSWKQAALLLQLHMLLGREAMSFFEKLFGTKAQNHHTHRSLNLEPLELRILLSGTEQAMELFDADTVRSTITGEYDASLELVVDPSLDWSTYLGGSLSESGLAVATDGSGNVFVTGPTESAGWLSGGFDTSYNGGGDAFVVKLSSTGEHLWSTYLGGSSDDVGTGVAVNGSGEVFVVGHTDSSGWVSGGWDDTLGGTRDGFVVKLSSSGDLLWSSYLGGSGYDEMARDVAVDGSGDVFVSGSTDSPGWVSGGGDESFGGDNDGFVVKLSSTGEHLWSTYLGGEGWDQGRSIAVDGSGDVFVAGPTHSSSGWVSGGVLNGAADAFVLKLAGDSGDHIWSRYLGGSGNEEAWGVAVDGSGSVFVTGQTTPSSGWVSGGWDESFNGGSMDGFVVKLSGSGEHLWSTYLGGSDKDVGFGIAVDGSGDVFVSGCTHSSGWVSGGWDESYDGGEDGFVVKLAGGSGGHIWSSYLGGSADDTARDIVVGDSGDVFVTGPTTSSGWVSGGWDTSYNGDGDAFVAKIAPGDEVFAWQSGDVLVSAYDVLGEVDVSPADIQVTFGAGGSVSSIKLGGYEAMEGLGIVISGASSVGSIKDGRKGELGDVAFIASDAPIKSIQLRGSLSGYGLNGLTLGGIALPADIDGDGDTDDTTAIYSAGAIGSIKVDGDALGDVWIGAADAKGMALKSFQSKYGGYHGDFTAYGDVGKVSLGSDFGSSLNVLGSLKSFQLKGGNFEGELNITGGLGKLDIKSDKTGGGWFYAGSNVTVGGLLKSVKIAACETDNGGEDFGIFAESFGKLTIGNWKLGPLDLPFQEDDFRVERV